MIKNIRKFFFIAAGLSGAALLIAGVNNYPGSKLVYMLFSAMFWLMLLTSFGKRTHYGYLFLVIALWLGFWGKITAHLLYNYPYIEPIGKFDGLPTSWDNVLWVAIMASVGVMLGKLVITLLNRNYSRVVEVNSAIVPTWYVPTRKLVWALALILIVGSAVINMLLGIQQVGLAPRTVLPWPLNALIALQVSIGSALLLTVLLWWEISLKKHISVTIYAIFFEAIAATTSLLSRGVLIFHTLPQMFSLYENRKCLVGLSKTKISLQLLVLIALLIVSIAGVTTFRAYFYPREGGFTTEEQQRLTRLEVLEGGIAHVKTLIFQGEPQEEHLRELLAEKAQLEKQKKLARLEVLEGGIAHVKTLIFQGEPQEKHLQELLAEKTQLEKPLPKNEKKNDEVVADDKTGKVESAESPVSNSNSLAENKDKLLSEFYFQIKSGALPRILSLAVDRWIGLEGVMAVSAYPEKGSDLLFDAATEKREIGKVTKFQHISSSHYRWIDGNTWQFASLPGAAAFLYFSGSLWVVMLGMAIFSLLIQLSEQLVFTLTSNPLLCSLFGLTLANTVTQFGIAPRQDIPFYSMIFGFVLLVAIVQSDKVYGMLRKFAPNRDDRDTV